MRKENETRKRNPVRVIIMIILLAVIAFCLYKIVPYTINNLHGKKVFDELSQSYTKVGDSTEDEWWYTDVDVDVAGLQAKYPDVIGWVRFDHPDDEILIDYPILYSGDDETYLHHDMDKKYSYPGCVFLEGENSPDLKDMNSIIYGHNMRNGTMFGTLKHMQEEGVYKNNRFFTIYTAKKAYRYEVFSYFTTNSRSDIYTIGFGPDEAYREYLDDLVSRSAEDTGVVPETDQRIVLLSTCKGSGTDYRFVVCGVCVAAHDYPVKKK